MISNPSDPNANMWTLLNLKKGNKKEQSKKIGEIFSNKSKIEDESSLVREKNARKLVYQSSKARMDLWKNPVHRNRLNDNLQFPLKSNKIEFLTSNSSRNKFDALKSNSDSLRTSLYNSIYKNKRQNKEIIDPFTFSKIIRKKRDNYYKERARQDYFAQKMAIKKKIKSKNFHRHMKRRHMKEFEKEIEKYRQTDPEEFQRRLLEVEKLRAKERISLKHRNGSKFSKIQKMRSKYNLDSRNAVFEMMEHNKELMKKNNEDDEDSSGTEIGLESSDEEDNDSDNLEINYDSQDSDQEDALKSVQWWNKIQKSNEDQKMDESACQDNQNNPKMINAENFKSILDNNKVNSNEQLLEDHFMELCTTSDGQDAELENEFAKEKKEIEEEEKLQNVDKFLPAWNTWSGPGTEERDKLLHEKHIIQAPKRKRRDKNMKTAIVRERITNELKKHLVKTIPFPYNNIEDYEKSLAHPLIEETNTRIGQKLLSKPRIVVKKGSIIKPIDESAAILREVDIERLNK